MFNADYKSDRSPAGKVISQRDGKSDGNCAVRLEFGRKLLGADDKNLILLMAAMLIAIGLSPGFSYADAHKEAGGQPKASNSIEPPDEKVPPRKFPTDAGKLEDRKLVDNSDNSLGGYLRTLGALALVVVLIFLVGWLLRRFARGGRALGGRGPVEVLSRTAITPRQQLLLVRLGERIVLVGCTPGGFSTLSEITGSDETARLMAEIAESRRGVLGGAYKRKNTERTGEEGKQ
jgi:flagellar biosynthetic protein FliO